MNLTLAPFVGPRLPPLGPRRLRVAEEGAAGAAQVIVSC
jgi:hypothetical protein